MSNPLRRKICKKPGESWASFAARMESHAFRSEDPRQKVQCYWKASVGHRNSGQDKKSSLCLQQAGACSRKQQGTGLLRLQIEGQITGLQKKADRLIETGFTDKALNALANAYRIASVARNFQKISEILESVPTCAPIRRERPIYPRLHAL